ncbi:MAG: Fic family protein [Boseongicola sp.]|nr:Fic family protein [Boseongicola sp.]
MHAILEVRNLSWQERAVMETLLRTPDPVSQRELMSRMRDAPSQATMSRIMSGLIVRGLLAKEGQTRGARFFLPSDVRRVATDPRRRAPIPYDPDRIGGYVPNETRWLPKESAERMQAAVDRAGMQRLDASTWSRAIAERFLIDLSWASSNLEGNTYDHLSTELLVKYGQSASGRDLLETAMILNHKAAISAVLDGIEDAFPDAENVRRCHVLMMRDLVDPADLGTVRRSAARVSASSYRPSSDRVILASALGDLMAKARKVENPFEASFLLLAGLSYLQAFGDGNKRMGRLLSNEPLLRAGLPPLTFIGIDQTPYVLGLIEFYETGATGLLGEAISLSYETTVNDHVHAMSGQRVPHALEIRERARISDALERVFRDRMPDEGVPGLVDVLFDDLVEEDRSRMVEILAETASRASPVSAFLYGLTEEDIQERNVANRRSGVCRECRRTPCECTDGSVTPGF